MLSFWRDESDQHLMTIDSFDCVITKVIWTCHSICLQSPTDCYVSLCRSLLNVFGFLYLKYECSECLLVNPETWKHFHEEKRSDVRNWNWKTCCPYRIKRRQLIEHHLLVASDILSSPCTKTGKLSFSGCSAWLSRESLILQLLYSRTLFGAGRGMNLPFA